MGDLGGWDACYKSEVIKKTLDPRWKEFEVPLQKLNNGDCERPLKFEVFDWSRTGKEEFNGEFVMSLNELVKCAQGCESISLINPVKQKKKKKYCGSGEIVVEKCEICRPPTFNNYLLGGLKINLTCSIDFTASNLQYDNPKSLHYHSR